MKNRDWSLEEFKAYLYIYCTFADHMQVVAERNYAIEKVGLEEFKKMHEEIEKDTDDKSINMIRKFVKNNKLSEEFVNELLKEIEGIFLSDGQFHKLERRLFGSLQHIFAKRNNA